MSAIKRFFERKKLERKFKKAGVGHSLKEERQLPQMPACASPGPSFGGARVQTEEQQRATEAALLRKSVPTAGSCAPRTTKDVVRAQVKREMELERLQAEQAEALKKAHLGPQEVRLDSAQIMKSAAGGVMYTCAIMPDVYLPKKEMEEKIRQFLYDQLEEDAEMASALMIHTLNPNAEKVKVCIDTMCTYLDNIIQNPGEEKYRKIRCANKAFCDRIAALKGSLEFLKCAGFKSQKLPFQDNEVDFLVMSESSADLERLASLKETLINAEPIKPELHRALKVLHTSDNSIAMKFGEIPREFYNITPEELKREQQARQEAVEKLGMLRTKAMRERDELKELRKYRYTLLRVRFPGDIMLQGVFKSTETLADLMNFVREHLQHEWLPFVLLTSQGQKLTEESKTFAELHLVPACIVQFSCNQDMLKEANEQCGLGKSSQVLNNSTLAKGEELSE